MKFKNITIQKLLVAGAVLITLILTFIIFFSNFSIKDTINQFRLISSIKDIKNKELEIRNAENNVLVYDIINPDFYMSGQSVYIEKINENLAKINQELDELANNSNIKKLQLTDQIKLTQQDVDDYKTHIDALIRTLLAKGFKDFGYVGNMRKKIHNVESELKNIDNDKYSVYMLTLRRHEKDYLLRKDLKYRDKFNAAADTFIQEIKNGPEADQYLIPIIEEYRDIFKTVVKEDVVLGLDNNKGIRYEIANSIASIESNLNSLSSIIRKTSEKKIHRTVFNISLFIVILSLVIIYILFSMSRHIVKSIVNLKNYITRLGQGELPEEIPIYNDDEIAHMKGSINELTKNLRNTKAFAQAVGNGNFDKEVNVFGNTGDLGSALVDMRKQIIQVSQEREKQIKESNERLWSNEGFNQIHDILSSNKNSEEQLFYTIISKLTQYLGANQGTLLISDIINHEQVLVTKGTFAFDRNKINHKEIKVGEGLIGSVTFEKQSLYMTDLPENYINITSGLGDAPPQYLLIVPCLSEDEIVGVIEIASFKPMEKYQIEFVEKVATDIANNIKKIRIEQTTKQLLEKTQKQANELTEAEEELRQNLEELKTTQESMEHKEREMITEIKRLKEENEKLKQQYLEPSMQ